MVLLMPYKRLVTSDQDLDRVQSRIDDAFKQVDAIPLLSGNTIEATIGVTDTAVNHKLQRKFQGWIVIDQDANAVIWRSNVFNPLEDKQLILKASAPVNVKLYVF